MKKFLATLAILILVIMMATPCLALELTNTEAKLIVVSLSKARIETIEQKILVLDLQQKVCSILLTRLEEIKKNAYSEEIRIDAERTIASTKVQMNEMRDRKQKTLEELKQAKNDLALKESLPD